QQSALPKIVEDERRLDHGEPGELDWLAAEVAEVGIERGGASDGEEHQAHNHEADHAMRQDEPDPEARSEGEEDARIVDEMHEATDSERDKPRQHDRPEVLCDFCRPARL